MTAGPMRDRIAFDKREDLSTNSPAGDGHGNMEGDWEEQFERWGRLRPKLGGEQVMASRLQGVQPFTITVRFDNETRLIKSDWRARNVADDTIYAILSVMNPDEKKKYIELTVTAGEVA